MKAMKKSAVTIYLSYACLLMALCVCAYAFTPNRAKEVTQDDLNERLRSSLTNAGFTGQVGLSLEKRLGRKLDPRLVEVGQLIFFDKFLGLHEDNSCAGCHSPAAGFGDPQPIAIGVDNNNVVGPHRTGPRNQRHTPGIINNAFYPALMWNGRFSSLSGDPFDNSKGFSFPAPEGLGMFPPNDSNIKHLLVAQAHIPFTELSEMAGFTGIRKQTKVNSSSFNKVSSGSREDKDRGIRQFAVKGSTSTKKCDEEVTFEEFDDGKGTPIPDNDPNDLSRNNPIRQVVLQRINNIPEYRSRFAEIYPQVARGGSITFAMVGQAVAEFEMSLTFADAPVDHFARGEMNAMTDGQKRGALLFFGEAKCVQCHAVAGKSNEMFSDFANRCIGIPQIAPKFGKGSGNVGFRNSDGKFVRCGNQDFGLEDITGTDQDPRPQDRYKFRTAPLRNVSVHTSFFHNGAFTRLEDAIRYHLDPTTSARSYDPEKAGVPEDLRGNIGPIAPVLQQLDPLMKTPIRLTDQEFKDLVEFVRTGLLDQRALPENLRSKIPTRVPSGKGLQLFEFPGSGSIEFPGSGSIR
jgi:cytochrome c peroxidase